MTPDTSEKSPAPLTEMQERFCVEFPFAKTAAEAAFRAGAAKGSAKVTACRWLNKPEILARIEEIKAERRERLKLRVDDQLLDMVEMLHVDANEIVEYRRVNCRRCWGVGHRYQWGDVEAEEAQERWDELDEAAKQKQKAPDFRGGIGFNPWREPNPCCPNCGGEGESRPYFHDTRKLSPAARRLYQGVQITRDGAKVVMVDRDGLLDKVNRALGLYKDKVELTGKDGGAIQHQMRSIKDMTDAELEAELRQLEQPSGDAEG